MNRVTPDTPLPEITALLQRDGYVLMENAQPLRPSAAPDHDPLQARVGQGLTASAVSLRNG